MLAYYYSVFMHVINETSSEQFQPLLYPSPVFATLFHYAPVYDFGFDGVELAVELLVLVEAFEAVR